MKKHSRFILFLVILICKNTIANNLTLVDVENIAINQAPELDLLKNKEESLLDLSISESRLPDPMMQVGMINVPTDTFNLKQDNMTQLKFGVMQNIPKGSSLSIKSKYQQLLAESEKYNYLNTKSIILKVVRNEWLNLYYWLNSLKIIDKNIVTFKHLVKVSESIYSSGKTNQHDVFQAQLELSKLESQKIYINEQIDITRALLAEWVGNNIASKLSPTSLPKWKKNFNPNILENKIISHPKIRQDIMLVNAKQKNVNLAEQDYKPGWNLGAYYSIRQGDFSMTNKKKTDFAGIQVSFDLPLFTKNKQDKVLSAKLKELNSAKDMQRVDYKKLQTDILHFFAIYQKLQEQDKFYQTRLLPEANQFAKATLIAYKNNKTDFLTVARAHVADLNMMLEGLKVKVDYKKAIVALLYLEERNYK